MGKLFIKLLLALVVVLTASLLLISVLFRPPELSQYDQPEPTLVDPNSMRSEQLDQFEQALIDTFTPKTNDVELLRRQSDEFMTVAVESTIIPVDLSGVPAEWVYREPLDSDCRILYLHGGAFSIGSPEAYRLLTDDLATRTGCAVLVPDYRLRPENPITASFDDSRTAYKHVLEAGPSGTQAPSQVFIVGDSAGGALTLATTAWARDEALRLPDAIIAISPLTDGFLSGPSMRANAANDKMLGGSLGPMMKLPKSLVAAANRMVIGLTPEDTRISPVLGDLAGLPPILITASKTEMLYSDSVRYANKARSQGVDVQLLVWKDVSHAMPAFGPDLPEAIDARERIAEFINGFRE